MPLISFTCISQFNDSIHYKSAFCSTGFLIKPIGSNSDAIASSISEKFRFKNDHTCFKPHTAVVVCSPQ